MSNYDELIFQFAELVEKTHGDLVEVFFVNKNKYQSILHFNDGTYLPTKPETSRDMEILKYAFSKYSYIPPEGIPDPLTLFTFGYHGTGSQCFQILLKYFKFINSNVEDISSKQKLNKTGSAIDFSEIPLTRIRVDGSKDIYFPD